MRLGKEHNLLYRFLLCALFLLAGHGCKEPTKPTIPKNNDPVILELAVFPSPLVDSAVVICSAMDPDADSLVYDWYTDGRLRFKGASTVVPYELYHVRANFVVIFREPVPSTDSLGWVVCSTRDGRGGAGVRKIDIPLLR